MRHIQDLIPDVPHVSLMFVQENARGERTTGQSHLKLNYNVQYGNKNYHTAKRKGGDRNRIKANEVKDNEEGKRALVGQTDRTGRR